MNNQSVLSTEDLGIGYVRKKETFAVHSGINLNLFAGEMVCLVGPNGSGKSTLLRTIAGLQAPLSGTVRIQGKDIANLSSTQIAHLRSVVLTNKFDSGYFTVHNVVAMGRYPFMNWAGKLSADDEHKIALALEQTGMSSMSGCMLNELSDGELQRAMIAKALTQESPVILLDEPTAHLDLPNRVAIMKLLRNLAKQTGTAIVLSTHELDLALQSADRFWLMSKQNEITCGMPEDLALNGTVAQAFNSNNVHFDTESGVFVMHKTECGSIGLTGEGAEYFWTKKALERNGFSVTDTPHEVTICQQNGKTIWKTFRNGKSNTFDQLSALIQWLLTS